MTTCLKTGIYKVYIIYNSHFLRQKAKNILTYKVSVAIPTNLMNLKSTKSSTEKQKVNYLYTQKLPAFCTLTQSQRTLIDEQANCTQEQQE